MRGSIAASSEIEVIGKAVGSKAGRAILAKNAVANATQRLQPKRAGFARFFEPAFYSVGAVETVAPAFGAFDLAVSFSRIRADLPERSRR